MRTFAVRLGLSILFLGLLAVFGQARVFALQPGRAIPADEFWQRVDQGLLTLRGLKSGPEADIVQALDGMADQWAALDAILLPDGSTSALDTRFIVSQLRRRPYDLDSLNDVFANLQKAQQLKPTRAFSAADVSALQAILQSPEFQWERPPSPLEELWNSLLKRIDEWLDGIFGGKGISIPIPLDLLTIFASILLVFVLAYIFRGLFADLIVETSLDEEHLAGDELLTAETALQKARDISKGGDYRTAVRYLYLSSLLVLDEHGLMRFDRSKTNREYLRSVASFPSLSAPLREVIDVFDRVWYGFQVIDKDDFQHYLEKVDQLREQKK